MAQELECNNGVESSLELSHTSILGQLLSQKRRTASSRNDARDQDGAVDPLRTLNASIVVTPLPPVVIEHFDDGR